MRPIIVDRVAWFVCLSVGNVLEPCKTAEMIEMPFRDSGLTRVGQRNRVLHGSRSPRGMGNFGVIGFIQKHLQSLLQCSQQRPGSFHRQ